jgi:hypothetical protein
MTLFPPEYASISYVTFDAVVADVLKAGRGCTIVKRDIRDAFRLVPVAADDSWALLEGSFLSGAGITFRTSYSPFPF